MLKKHRIILTLSVLFLIMLAACRPATLEIAPDITPLNGSETTVRFGYIKADQLHSPAVMIMKEQKLLEAAGFNVEWHEYTAGAYAMQDMTADIIDFANCGIVPIIINRSQGLDLTILAGSNQEGSSLVVLDSIKSVADLNGKTIATPGLGSIQDAMLTRLVKENDLNIHRTTMEISDMPIFLQKKDIDGYIAWAPHPMHAAEQKFGHELLTSKDMMPNHQCCVFVAKSEVLQNDQKTVKEVLEVYLKAYRWFMENQEKSVQMIAKITGIPETVISKAITSVYYSYPPYCNADSIENMTQVLIDAGKISAMDEAEIDDFTMNIYQPELMEEIINTKVQENSE